MKVKVISSFRDKFTKKIHQPGEELDLTNERADEILNVGKFIELLEEPKQQGKSADEEEPKKPADDEKPKSKGKKKNNKSNEENAG